MLSQSNEDGALKLQWVSDHIIQTLGFPLSLSLSFFSFFKWFKRKSRRKKDFRKKWIGFTFLCFLLFQHLTRNMRLKEVCWPENYCCIIILHLTNLLLAVISTGYIQSNQSTTCSTAVLHLTEMVFFLIYLALSVRYAV